MWRWTLLWFVHFRQSQGVELFHLNRLLFRAIYSLGRASIFESVDSNLNPIDDREYYDFVPIQPANMRGFLANLARLYPGCPSVSYGFRSFIEGAFSEANTTPL